MLKLNSRDYEARKENKVPTMSRAPLYQNTKLEENSDNRSRGGFHPSSSSINSRSHSSNQGLPPQNPSNILKNKIVNTNLSTKEDWGNGDCAYSQEERESDSGEVKELKSRLKIMMNKLNTMKREKESVSKENKGLQEEILVLQCNLRQMIQGFSNNTSSSFPMQNELTVQIAEYYKCDCLDLFFDLLVNELNLKGILFFYKQSFNKLQEVISNYLQPAIDSVKTVGCFEVLDGPILNVIRKTYQSNHKKIIQKCLTTQVIKSITDELQYQLKLGNNSFDTHDIISAFLTKMGEIIMLTMISDPPLFIDVKSIGTKISYNALKHDPFDGFIKAKEECVIVLPPVMKSQSSDAEIVAKALVLQSNYEIPG